MATLAIINPATGGQIDEVPADDAATVALKAAQARAAQPRWQRVPLTERKACIERFRALVVRDLGADLYTVISSAAERTGHTLGRRMNQRIRTKRRLGMRRASRLQFA